MVKGAGGHRRLCAVGSSWLSSPVSLRGRSALSRLNDLLGCVLGCDVACHVVVVVVGGGCEQMAMVVVVAAVGDGGDVAGLGCF